MHAATQLCQQSAEGQTTVASQGRRILLLQGGVKGGGGHDARSLLTRPGKLEVGSQHLFGRRHTIEGLVRCLYLRFLALTEPAAFTLLQFVLQLGIKLGMLHWRGAVYFVLHLHADEAPAARSVCQQVATVARTDERSDALQRFGTAAVGTAQIQVLHLHQVLQLRHAGGRQLVELVQIDESEGGQLVLGSSGVAQVEAFGEVAAQLGGHQQAAEGRFAHPLHGTHQDGRHAVGTFATRVVPHPACCQSQHPAVERAHPKRIVRYPGSQRRHPVATVPGGQRVEVTGKGMVTGHVVRLHVAAHVAVPTIDAFGDGRQRNAVQQAVVHRLIYKVVFTGCRGVAQGAFGLLRQAVVAEGIAQAQEAQQPMHGLLLLRGLPVRGGRGGRNFGGSGGRFLMHRFGGGRPFRRLRFVRCRFKPCRAFSPAHFPVPAVQQEDKFRSGGQRGAEVLQVFQYVFVRLCPAAGGGGTVYARQQVPDTADQILCCFHCLFCVFMCLIFSLIIFWKLRIYRSYHFVRS